MVKLGKLPVRHDPRTLRMRAYLRASDQLPAPPTECAPSSLVTTWPMYGNDRLGDCTYAAVGHMVQQWTAMVGAVVTPNETDIVSAYSAMSPGDDGCVELDVLNSWHNDGIAGHFIAGYTALDLGNRDHIRLARSMFGGVYLGAALPRSCMDQETWDVVENDGGFIGGHAINVVGYDPDGLTFVTWGGLKKMTWAFWAKYVDEAYCPLTEDWRDQVPANSIGFDDLLRDLEALEA